MRFSPFVVLLKALFVKWKFHLVVLDGEESIYVSLLQPTRGRITVAEEDLRTFDKSEWARVVSIVNQVYSWISIHLLQACHAQMYCIYEFIIISSQHSIILFSSKSEI